SRTMRDSNVARELSTATSRTRPAPSAPARRNTSLRCSASTAGGSGSVVIDAGSSCWPCPRGVNRGPKMVGNEIFPAVVGLGPAQRPSVARQHRAPSALRTGKPAATQLGRDRQALDRPHPRPLAPADLVLVDRERELRPAAKQRLERARGLDAREL